MKTKTIATMLCALFAFTMIGSGCSSSANLPPLETIPGSWVGVVGTQSMNMTLVVNSGVVTGTGTLSNVSLGPLAGNINGTFTSPTFDATFASGLHPAINIHGTVAGNTLKGTMTGSGFTGDSVTFVRS